MSLVKRDYKEVDWNVTNEVVGEFQQIHADITLLNTSESEGIKIHDLKIAKIISCYFKKPRKKFSVRIMKHINYGINHFDLRCKIIK